MLGPVAGGVLIHYFHWSVIFFLNVPIGLIGLYLVYRHLPDYRGETTHRLDVAGLILFGSGVALLSYVLEVFGEHFLSTREIIALLALSLALLVGYGINSVRSPLSVAAREAVSSSHVFRRSGRQLRDATRCRRNSVPDAVAVSDRIGVDADPVRSDDGTASHCGDELEAVHVRPSHAVGLPKCPDREHTVCLAE